MEKHPGMSVFRRRCKLSQQAFPYTFPPQARDTPNSHRPGVFARRRQRKNKTNISFRKTEYGYKATSYLGDILLCKVKENKLLSVQIKNKSKNFCIRVRLCYYEINVTNSSLKKGDTQWLRKRKRQQKRRLPKENNWYLYISNIKTLQIVQRVLVFQEEFF